MMRAALVEQFQASLAMLAECVAKCPEDLWKAGEPQRETWRIALHAAFFTHVGLFQDELSFTAWAGAPAGFYEEMWGNPAYVEPYELPVDSPVFSREHTLRFIESISAMTPGAIKTLDLDRPDSGFRWYPNMSKASNLLMTLRHLQGHVGQLSELLIQRGIDTGWVGKGTADAWQRYLARCSKSDQG